MKIGEKNLWVKSLENKFDDLHFLDQFKRKLVKISVLCDMNLMLIKQIQSITSVGI